MFNLTGKGSSRRREDHASQDGHTSTPTFEQLEDRLLLSLLGVAANFEPPEISYNSTGTVTYDAASESLDCEAIPLGLVLESGARPLRFSDPSDFQLHIQIDNDGNLIGGVEGDDLMISGLITSRSGTLFDGVLLTGEIIEYGELDSGTAGGNDGFDFRFAVTGGLLESYFENFDIGVDMTASYWAGAPEYSGSFQANFEAQAWGTLGVIPQLPPPPEPGSVAGTVTANGTAGIEGITVTLSDGAGATATAVTNAAGEFVFTDVVAGTYSLSAEQSVDYLDGDESATDVQAAIGNDVISNIVVDAGEDATGYNFNEIDASLLQGLVYEDFNDDGALNFGEASIENVTVTLSGTDDRGVAVSETAATDAQGLFWFVNLRPGTYAITESQPVTHTDGQDALGTAGGTLGNDVVTGITLGVGQDGMDYNFGERPVAGGELAAGQTATIGFWQNKNGQSLIKALNGGANATELSAWLAATFPNIFGVTAGANNLTGQSNADVADYYRSVFKAKKKKGTGPAKVDAQVMATAFAVYATNSTLAGQTATGYGFLVSEYGVGNTLFNIGEAGDAFGVEDYTLMAILDILLATDDQAVDGALYNMDAFLRGLANEVYSAINEGGDI